MTTAAVDDGVVGFTGPTAAVVDSFSEEVVAASDEEKRDPN